MNDRIDLIAVPSPAPVLDTKDIITKAKCCYHCKHFKIYCGLECSHCFHGEGSICNGRGACAIHDLVVYQTDYCSCFEKKV